MPHPRQLKLGDRIRIKSVPIGDENEYRRTNGKNKDTYEVLKWMVGREFEIEIVDEYHPWIIVRGYPAADYSEHSMAICDNDSWEFS